MFYHIVVDIKKHIFEEGELDETSTVRNFRTLANNGKYYEIKYYNLDMIIAVGYRVKSNIGTNLEDRSFFNN